MSEKTIEIEYLPQFREPLLILGFEGWGNALDISRGMVDYLIKKLNARPFGAINSDIFYRYDENRPVVEIKNGLLGDIKPPEGTFYEVHQETSGKEMILLKAVEPNLQWFRFVDSILSLCEKIGVKTIISLGSMYDNVLHTDKVVSAFASSEGLIKKFEKDDINPTNYKGPSAIHSTIHAIAASRGFESISLWCHCPYYLQGTTHFGLLSHLGGLLASLGGFQLDTDELETTWEELSKQIQGLIDKNPELQSMINNLRKAKVKVTWNSAKRDEKVIHLEDFIKPK